MMLCYNDYTDWNYFQLIVLFSYLIKFKMLALFLNLLALFCQVLNHLNDLTMNLKLGLYADQSSILLHIKDMNDTAVSCNIFF